jgi:hypothetical protein
MKTHSFTTGKFVIISQATLQRSDNQAKRYAISTFKTQANQLE